MSTSSSAGAGSYRVLAVVDYPAKEAVITLDAKATIGDLRAAVQKATNDGLNAKALPRYALQYVAYRTEPVDLSGAKVDDKTPLSQFKLADAGTVLLRAPADIAPRKRMPKAKAKEEKEEKAAPAVSKDRYKGITVNNIWKKLEEKGLPVKTKTLNMEFFDIYAAKLVPKAQFTLLKAETVIAICKSDTLSIKEVDLFDGVVAWGKAELKRSKDAKDGDLKTVLKDILPLIRFPCMSTQDVAVKVTSSGLLDSDAILELFTYLGTKSNSSKAPTPGKSIAKFPTKDRKGRRPPSWFKWDTNKKNMYMSIEQEGTVLRSTNTGTYVPAFADVELNDGVWEWEVQLTQFQPSTYAVHIGVSPTTFTNWNANHMLGYSSHVSGWAFGVGSAQKFKNQNGNETTAYGRQATQGDVIGVRLDLDKSTLEFYINGQSQGIAFRDVKGPVRPSLSIYGNHSVTLRFPGTEFKPSN